MEENATIATVLQELRDFRAENNKRWEQNDRRWEENNRRWEENDKRWEENDKRWEQNEERWILMEKKVEALEETSKKTNQRLSALEIGTKEDRREILDVLETMQKSIDNRFTEMKDYMDLKFEKIDLALAVNNMEHAEFRKLLKAYGIRLDFYGARLQSLERWRDDINDGCVGVIN